MEGIANNVGGMSYSFPIAKLPSVAQFRKEVGGAKWQALRVGTLTLTLTLTLARAQARARALTLTLALALALALTR